MTSPVAAAAAERLESVEALDPLAKKIGKVVRDTIPGGPVKDALSGVWLGHALHPLLTDTVIGTWTSASLLDLLGGADTEKAARRLVGLGIAFAGPTVVTGWSDWADSEVGDAGVRRAGIVHATSNAAALTLMTGSWLARRRGAGKKRTLAAMGLLGVGGWLGSHMTYSQGVGVDTTVFDKDLEQWTGTGVRESDLPEGTPRCGLADGTPILLVRHQGQLKALHNRCSHRGGPLNEGDVSGGTVTCPWHGSVFRLEDGSIERGPAAYPQPSYDVRVVTDGEVEVRIRAH
jgi:nitrite reductase/ring-hydroxylating ferredoxin subunit/uncharacterized membrane protein